MLDLPLVIKCLQTNIEEDRITTLCMLLQHLAYPIRLVDVEMQLGWERSRFSRIKRLIALILFNRWKHLLRFDPIHLNPVKLAEFGTAVAAKGAPLDVVVALIDGTLQKNACPSNNQWLVYNGWKHIHCLNYHALISPDGIIIHIYGPVMVDAMTRLSTRKVDWQASSKNTSGPQIDNHFMSMVIQHTILDNISYHHIKAQLLLASNIFSTRK